jgi:hypothetical protein
MVGTILPIVHGERRNRKPPIALALHVSGYLFGSATMGVLLGLLGAFSNELGLNGIRSPVLLLVGVLSVLFAAHELRLIRLPLPSCRRQVPSRWRFVLRPRTLAFAYSYGLGLGFLTMISTTTFYLVTLWIVLSGGIGTGVITMLLFGLGRALPMIAVAPKIQNAGSVRQCVQRLDYWNPAMHAINGLALAFAGSLLTTAGLVR